MHLTGTFSETLNSAVAPGTDLQADLLRREITKLADIPDAEIEKFVKPITVKGKRRWRIVFWHPYKHLVPKNKQRIRIRARSATKVGAIMEAKQHWLRCKDEIKEAVAPPKKPSLEEFAVPWNSSYCLRGHRGRTLAQSTVVTNNSLLYAQVLPLFGQYPIDAIDYHLMDEVFRRLALEDYAGNYVSNIKAMLSCILKSALHKKIIHALPVFPPVPVNKPEGIFLRDEYKAAILDAAANPVDMTAYLLMFDSGMRPGEELGLEPCNISLSSGWAAVTQSFTPHSRFAPPGAGRQKIPTSPGFKPPKTRRSRRRIPLTDAVCDAIKAHIDLSKPLLFGGMTTNTLHDRFAAAVERSRVPVRLTPYSLRHVFATTLLNRGVHGQLIMKWLGHTGITMTENYAQIV
jgi:integrase